MLKVANCPPPSISQEPYNEANNNLRKKDFKVQKEKVDYQKGYVSVSTPKNITAFG